jgi:Domain of unknown function (DUF4145)
MQVFLDCPHCLSKRVGMFIWAKTVNNGGHGIVFATCNHCTQPVTGVFRLNDTMKVRWQVENFDVISSNTMTLLLSYPGVRKNAAPDHVDSSIGNIFVQAEDARMRGQYHTAGMGLRKTLDIALKRFDPSLKGDLYSRINSLADKHTLTPAMREWAHQVRLIGNEAAHDDEEPTKVDIEAMSAFTETLLKYLFTLPAEVDARRAKP